VLDGDADDLAVLLDGDGRRLAGGAGGRLDVRRLFTDVWEDPG